MEEFKVKQGHQTFRLNVKIFTQSAKYIWLSFAKIQLSALNGMVSLHFLDSSMPCFSLKDMKYSNMKV